MDKELKVFLCIMLILFTISTIVLVVKNIEVEEPKTQKKYFCPLPNSKDEFLQNFENKNNQANIEDVIVTKYNYEDYEGLPVNSSMIIDYAYSVMDFRLTPFTQIDFLYISLLENPISAVLSLLQYFLS